MKNRIVGGHVPSAKIVGERRYSIISDYLGTPIEVYDEAGKRVRTRELDIYGRTHSEEEVLSSRNRRKGRYVNDYTYPNLSQNLILEGDRAERS